MSKIFTVMKFEFLSIVKKKAWIISTIIVSLLLFSLQFIIPIFLKSGSSSINFSDTDNQSSNKLFLFVNDSVYSKEELSKILKDTEIVYTNSEEELQNKVKDENLLGLSISTDQDVTLYSNDTVSDEKLDEFSEKFNEYNISKKYNIDYEKFISEKSNTKVKFIILEERNMFKKFIGMAIWFVLYFLILSYGSIIATSVAKEKSTKVMEVLITTTSTNNLLFGKVLGSCLASFLQIAIYTLSALATLYSLSIKYAFRIGDIFSIDLSTAIIIFILTLLGFVLYMFCFATVASTVNSLDQLNSAISPLTILIIAAYFIAYQASLAGGGRIANIASYVPFTSPFVMISRATSESKISIIEPIISIIILIISSIIIGMIAARIYRSGTLNYGKRKGVFKSLSDSFNIK